MPEYRTGNHQPRNIYRGNEYVGVCTVESDPADWARALVAQLNNPGSSWYSLYAPPSRPTDLFIAGTLGRVAVFFDAGEASRVLKLLGGESKDA